MQCFMDYTDPRPEGVHKTSPYHAWGKNLIDKLAIHIKVLMVVTKIMHIVLLQRYGAPLRQRN